MGDIYATRIQLTSLGVAKKALAAMPAPDLDSALMAASAEIDSYIGSRFKLPLQQWGMDLTVKCCEMAGYIAMRSRGFNPDSPDADSLRSSYKDAVAWLINVSKGVVTPAFPDTKDVNNYDPTMTTFAVQPAQGSIGSSSGGMISNCSDTSVAVGTVITPRLRGW